jgi:Protein of unknown function (DUF1553)
VVTLLNGRIVEEIRPAPEEKEQDSDDHYVDPAAKVRVPKYSRRAAFAEAATRDNPLLARAFVNRLWAVLFGRGIVHPASADTRQERPHGPGWLYRAARPGG